MTTHTQTLELSDLVLVGVLEVVDELHDLDLGLVEPGHVLEGDGSSRLVADLVYPHKLGLPKRGLKHGGSTQ